MKEIKLNKNWKMRDLNEDKRLEAKVPGSVFADLLNAGIMDNPFYRDNEKQALELSYHDYEYICQFNINEEILQYEQIILFCRGLDTLAEIFINQQSVVSTNNMHRSYKFDIKKYLESGVNNLKIVFSSASRFIEEKHHQRPLWAGEEMGDVALPGFYYLRKAHSMFGWDWGPRIPDAGIWRDISIVCFNQARLDSIEISQVHSEKMVLVEVETGVENWSQQDLQLELIITTPDKQEIKTVSALRAGESNHIFSIEINEPKLWWPNGYGKQPLYKVLVLLKNNEQQLDNKELKIGLRRFRVKQEEDQWGQSFEFEINDISIFARGANYIIEDNLLSRYSRERTERLIQDCIQANFNCIRVWGGGVYPDDYFYDLCDQYGLIVWQDFMFACSIYPVDQEFLDNIKAEIIDNIIRIRHHACLGLWCGNNEVEWILDILSGNSSLLEIEITISEEQIGQLKMMYKKIFEELIPSLVKEYDPERLYWPSSPSSGGGFAGANDGNRGDVHYWDVWHGLKPFTDYRNHYFRFASEYGFQSFPALETVKSFTLAEDRNIFSYIMERHQKNSEANGKILYYLSHTYKYPKDFESLLYTSQLLQAEAIKYGVEHWRRNRGRCMGSIYWQLNDCWPVASWSSIDYYGRWKALHYFAKRFYAPLLISALDEGNKIKLYITNDSRRAVEGKIYWSLRDNKKGIYHHDQEYIRIESLQAEEYIQLDFSKELNVENRRERYLEFYLEVEGEILSYDTLLFVPPKHFSFMNPAFDVVIEEKRDYYIIRLNSKSFAKAVELSLTGNDCLFSDNYFDLSAGYKKDIEVKKSTLKQELSLREFEEQLNIRCLYDIEER